MQDPVNILCMKWGKKYDASYVNKLYHMVERHLTLPHRFVCLTDDPTDIDEGVETFPLPEFANKKKYHDDKKDHAWNKLLTFSSPLYDLKGVALFLDLDIVIVDNIDAFFEPKGDFFIIKDWLRPQLTGNSSVYRFEIGKHSNILNNFINQEKRIRSTFRNEQEYLTAYMRQHTNLNYWDNTIIRSFKRHCMHHGVKGWFKEPTFPEKAKIVVFHGNPNPCDAIKGKSGKWFRKILPTPWVEKHWQ